MRKRLLVTGLTGFVGHHIRTWLDQHESVWELLEVPERPDLTDPEAVRAGYSQRPDTVIHLAGQTFVPEAFRDPAGTLQVNLLGTLNLLQALKALDFSGDFLYVSSGDIYGQVDEAHLPIREDLLPAPRNPYAVSKLAAEHLCLQWGMTEGWRVMIARPFNHVGAGQKENFVIASAARQIALIRAGLQEPRLLVGDIDVSRDFLDVRDVVSAYFALLEGGRPGQVYNVCSGEERRIRDLIQQLADLAQVEIELVQDPARMRRAEQRRVCGSHSKLHEATGWKPDITINQTLTAILSDWASRV
ncbi:GDP-mannose 4,6-dehydratase [Pseudomonas citronellolis]|uniref:GDP-mannose 4,6-dehydratase n=1 Tax=Pseudomonas citronellolis TaxID=53408 RepID=A0AAW6P8S3_9PSED|nr:GDP-mannose 4,6-dehydratase [Pseudomonas citronellolis]MDF3843095.1 GDP-mannose 4,6-dehydratase [Pseudomonas citronellolis]WBG64471.1 NAD-dependent epimerase/dehydratase family protein [Pseudomonas citronellolis]